MKRTFVILSFMWATPCLAQTDSIAKPATPLLAVDNGIRFRRRDVDDSVTARRGFHFD
jgi:hypothetical protein